MTATAARQSDELREALTEALAERLHPRNGMSERAVVRLADALLPVVTAWAERQARARAAEELFVLASRLVAQDVNDMAVYDEIRALRDGLTAALAADDHPRPNRDDDYTPTAIDRDQDNDPQEEAPTP